MTRTLVVWLFACGVYACAADSGYLLPPQAVVDIIDAKPEPLADFSPDGKWLLLVERDAMPGIADLARRKLQLAGMRIDPAANGPFQIGYGRGLDLRKRDETNLTRVPLADGARLGTIVWSHRSDRFAYTVVTDHGTELWMATIDKPDKPRRLTDRLSTVMSSIRWMPDGQRILCQLTPEKRGAEPAAPRAPSGPNIQESLGNTSPTRTFQDLLANPHDEALWEHYATAQLAIVDADGTATNVGHPAIVDSAQPSPDGKHLLVTTIRRPFSYLLIWNSFPQRIEVWNLDGTLQYLVADVPLEENIPIQGVRTGPRDVDWASSQPASLVWTEALDGGDPRKKVPHRDRLMSLAVPFQGDPRELLKTEHRAMGASYFRDPNLLSVTEYDRDRRWIRTLLHRLDQPSAPAKVLDDRSLRDRYNDPGRMVSVADEAGHSVILQDGPWVFLSGQGASPEGLLPFFDRRNLDSLASERLWRCEPGRYELAVQVAATADGAKPRIITRHESPESPPNYFLRDLAADGNRRLTDFADPTPQIRGIKKQIVKYQRADGVPLSATLYLPADHKPGQRLPLLVWAYPLEYSDADTAGQITASPSMFTRMTGISHLTLVTQGYAIMDGATMPVIGDPETANDTFVDQIVGAAKAAIDKAAEMGVADPNRACVGGHSYGAFMTANLLAHCDLFRAGVARSGAYNRTLTPFGFQSERRPLWEAKEIYVKLSPFMQAEKINEPLLLIHGENDNNPGTFPLQSQRMYQAVKGNGGTVRLTMLPYESHGYSARESVLHTQAETIAWLNKYVRDSSGVQSSVKEPAAGSGGE